MRLPAALTACVLLLSTAALAQLPAGQPPAGQPPAGQPAAGQGRGQGRGGPRGPQPLPFENHDGFTQIFDGTSLKGWDGDPKFWRADAGAIVGQTSADNKLTENTFIIWRGGEPGDFELKVEFRIDATNSGIQFRSVHLPAGTDTGRGGRIAGNWVLKGYQADIDFNNQYTGQIYEERGRAFLAMRGQYALVNSEGRPQVVGALESSADQLKALVKQNDWNQAHIIARGNMITEILNGHVTAVLIDDDAKGRVMKGLLGFQIHVGEPMKVEFRNIWLRQY
jgi:3-keto-disaccharide hydrolase